MATITGRDIAELINGTSGDDFLYGRGGNDTINGAGGNDFIRGDAGNDSLNGGGGNDTLYGGAGDDRILGGSGNDTIISQSGFDIVDGGSGVDTQIMAGGGAGANIENVIVRDYAANMDIDATGNGLANVMRDQGPGGLFMNGLAGNDTLYGGSGTNFFTFSGNASFGSLSYGRDVVNGGGGADWMLFGLNSAVVVNFANGTVSGGAGGASASIRFSSVERVEGSEFSDRITGGSGSEWMLGNLGNDTLTGGGGNDQISGDAAFGHPVEGGGNDVITGGAGRDELNGGEGGDRFLFRASAGSANADTIFDFTPGEDRLDFDDAYFAGIGSRGALAAGRFHAADGATAGHDANDRFVYDTGSGNLYYDADGSGARGALIVATLESSPDLDAGDIFVI